MRHAKSSWDDVNLSDHDRPLNSRGKRDAPRISQALSKLGWKPQLILLSSSTRTQETMSYMGYKDNIKAEIRSELYLPSIDQLLISMKSILESGTTMILAHNPGCELLLNHLTDEWLEMPTATAALLICNDDNWTLQKIIRPKELSNLRFS